MPLITCYLPKPKFAPRSHCTYIPSRPNEKNCKFYPGQAESTNLPSERDRDLQDVALGAHVVVAPTRHVAVLEAVTTIAEAIVDLGRR